MEPIAFLNPHWEALSLETQDTYRLIARLDWIRRFYLARGTGLALQLGHRFSVDLDLFSQGPDAVSADERSDLREALDDSSLEIIFDNDATFVANWRGVGVGFFKLQQYPLMLAPTPWTKMKRFLEHQAIQLGPKHLEDLWE
jgi:hypothetical protein